MYYILYIQCKYTYIYYMMDCLHQIRSFCASGLLMIHGLAWVFESVHPGASSTQETCKELSTLGGKVHGLAADVSSKEGREASYKQAKKVII